MALVPIGGRLIGAWLIIGGGGGRRAEVDVDTVETKDMSRWPMAGGSGVFVRLFCVG